MGPSSLAGPQTPMSSAVRMPQEQADGLEPRVAAAADDATRIFLVDLLMPYVPLVL